MKKGRLENKALNLVSSDCKKTVIVRNKALKTKRMGTNLKKKKGLMRVADIKSA